LIERHGQPTWRFCRKKIESVLVVNVGALQAHIVEEGR
jgi:hypothetical protein